MTICLNSAEGLKKLLLRTAIVLQAWSDVFTTDFCLWDLVIGLLTKEVVESRRDDRKAERFKSWTPSAIAT
jgi:hypothetical protein